MSFIPINEGFICEVCNIQVPPAKSTFRNHCPQCLNSKHVDASVPGDRAATCGGLMVPVRYEGTDPDQLDLIHQCQSCGKEQRNRTAPDDDRDQIFSILNS